VDSKTREAPLKHRIRRGRGSRSSRSIIRRPGQWQPRSGSVTDASEGLVVWKGLSAVGRVSPVMRLIRWGMCRGQRIPRLSRRRIGDFAARTCQVVLGRRLLTSSRAFHWSCKFIGNRRSVLCWLSLDISEMKRLLCTTPSTP